MKSLEFDLQYNCNKYFVFVTGDQNSASGGKFKVSEPQHRPIGKPATDETQPVRREGIQGPASPVQVDKKAQIQNNKEIRTQSRRSLGQKEVVDQKM